MKFNVDDRFSKALRDRLPDIQTKAAHSLAARVAEDTEPFVPARSGRFSRSTQVVGNRIVYPGPFAKFLYRGKAAVTGKPLQYSKNLHPKARDHWFEAAKALHLQNWIREAGKAVDDALH